MKLYKEQLKIILEEIINLERKHPKASVFYSSVDKGIKVVYPLPKDFFKFKENGLL